jgi:DNA-binding CsgD family transcriptional regulator
MRALAESGRHAPGVPVAEAAASVAHGWQGRGEGEAAIDRIGRDALARGPGRSYALSQYARAILYNGRGRFEEALAAAEDAVASGVLYVAAAASPELVEAAVRAGAAERGFTAAAEFTKRVSAGRSEWSRGMIAQTRALVATDADADRLYTEAVERLSRTLAAPHLARAHLLYGEWLRRRRRRREAREHLRRAHGMFVAMSADAFAARASSELDATGVRVGREPGATSVTLTAREHTVAGLAATGRSNAEIGEQLFISARTAEYHLHKIYRKLGLAGRVELAQWVLDNPANADDA